MATLLPANRLFGISAWAALFCLGLSACFAQSPTASAPPLNQEKTMRITPITVTGNLVYKNLEGGFWGLDAEDGTKYLPQGMDEKQLSHNAKVTIKGRIYHDMMTIQQYGAVLRVDEMTVLKQGDPKPEFKHDEY